MANSIRTHLSAVSAALVARGALVVLIGCGGGEAAFSGVAPAATPPQPTPAAAPSSGCAKDNDCKGERVCEKGECVAPR